MAYTTLMGKQQKQEPTLVSIWVTPATRQAIKQEALINNRTMIEELSETYGATKN